MVKEILIGWFTFIFALALAIGIIFVVGIFVLWVADKVDTAYWKYLYHRAEKVRKKREMEESLR